jgi:hypothetical protein
MAASAEETTMSWEIEGASFEKAGRVRATRSLPTRMTHAARRVLSPPIRDRALDPAFSRRRASDDTLDYRAGMFDRD